MAAAGLFSAASAQDVQDLLASAPMAWLVSAPALVTAFLPLQPRFDEAGVLLGFDGHLARAHPAVAALRQSPSALLLFVGVQGYVSPSWLQDRTQAPTWNSARLVCEAQVELVEHAAWLDSHLAELVSRHEAGRERAWSAEEMGPRLAQLSARLIGLRATCTRVSPTFKLGQDERVDVLHGIVAGFDHTGDAEMAQWMRRFNPHRLANA